MFSFLMYKIKVVSEDLSVHIVSSLDSNGRTTLCSLLNWLWSVFKVKIGWYTHRNTVLTMSAFVVWMGLGTAYAMCFENWSFITSLYWAIISCATGGLQSAPCLSDPAG